MAPASNVEILVAGTGRIAGTALDARSGQPLKNFSVSFEPDRGGGAIIRLVARGAGAQTGIGQKRDFNTEDGAFALEDVPAGTWTVVVEAKGYQQARVANLVVEENGSKDGVEVRATPGVVLKGRVSDARTGRPVANASITHEPAGAAGRAASEAVWPCSRRARRRRRRHERRRGQLRDRGHRRRAPQGHREESGLHGRQRGGGRQGDGRHRRDQAHAGRLRGRRRRGRQPAARERRGRPRGRGRRGLRPHPRRRPDDDVGRDGPLPLRPPRGRPLQRLGGNERQVEQPLGVRPAGGRLEERSRAVALVGLHDPGHRLRASGRDGEPARR